MVKVGAIIQARTGSERLPNKALLPLPFSGGPAILMHVVERAKSVPLIQEVIVATSTNEADNPIEDLCNHQNVACYRGSLEDVLDRFYQTAVYYELDIIVRLTGDNPFVMPDIINKTVQSHISAQADYTISEGLALGTNIEVVSLKALEEAAMQATHIHEREHVTPYIRQSKKLILNTIRFQSKVAHARLTVDYPSDYALANLLYGRLYPNNAAFDLKELEELICSQPWLLEINEDKIQKQVFKNQKEEIFTTLKTLKAGGFQWAYEKLKNIKDE